MVENELSVENLWQNPSLLESTIDSLPIAVSIISFPEFRFYRANSKYCSRLKTPSRPDDIRGVRVEDIFSPPSTYAVEAMRAAHQSGKITQFESLPSKNFGGEISYWNLTIAPFRRNRNQTLTIGFMADATGEVKRKRELENQRQRLLEAFFHEIRTPLTSVKTMNELIQKKLPELDLEELRRYLEQMNSYTNDLAENLSELGRFDASLKPTDS